MIPVPEESANQKEDTLSPEHARHPNEWEVEVHLGSVGVTGSAWSAPASARMLTRGSRTSREGWPVLAGHRFERRTQQLACAERKESTV